MKSILALIFFLACAASANAACSPNSAKPGMIGCQPRLQTPLQSTDLIQMWRPGDFPNSAETASFQDFLNALSSSGAFPTVSAGSLAVTGTGSFGSTLTVNGAMALTGGGLFSGTFTGNPFFSGTPTVSAAPASPLAIPPRQYIEASVFGGAPAPANDSTSSWASGGAWTKGGVVWQAQDVSSGFASWGRAQPGALPLDVIGQFLSVIGSIVSGGSGYAANDLIYFPGGASVKVLSQTGGTITQPSFTASITTTDMNVTVASTGVIAPGAGVFGTGVAVGTTILSQASGTPGGVGHYTLSISQSVGSESMLSDSVQIINHFASACPSDYPGTATQAGTSGSGSGASFNVTVLFPTAYATRQLSRCYSGHAMTVARSDSGETKNIDFVSGGLDVVTLDGFTSGGGMTTAYTNYNTGVSPRITTWNDQGGNGYHATQVTPASRPTTVPQRMIGNSRSVMFDSVGQSNTWNPTTTFLNIPTLQVAGNNNTIAVLAGSVTDNFKSNAFIQLGCQTGGCFVYGFDNGVFNGGFELANGGSANIAPIQTSDTPQLMVAVNSPTSTVFDVGNTTMTLTGGHIGPTALNAAGGTLGQAANNILTTGLVDEAMVVVVPWPIPAATRLAFEASVYQTFQIAPQYSAVIVTVGDSLTDGWGQPFQQSWPRQMMTLLNRSDVKLVNAGRAGANLSDLVSSGNWNKFVAPDLTATTLPRYVFLQGGHNDLTAGQTVSQVESSFTTGINAAHANGAMVVCVTNVLQSAAAGVNANLQTIAAWLRANSSCDYLLDNQAFANFDSVSGPYSSPWFQSDSQHLAPFGGASLEAEMAAKLIAPLLPAPGQLH